MVAALLLLIAGVERNPGPVTAGRRGDIVFGSFNIHSAVNRAALLHTIIADHNIDLLALQETWFDVTDPNAVQADVAPAGYGVLHVHRPSVNKKNRRVRDIGCRVHRGGGLAIVYRQELNVYTQRLQLTTKPSTFEYQLVAVGTNRSAGIIIINIYRPPSPWVAPQSFFDELADLVSAVITSSSRAVIVCGDLNCHGCDPNTVDDRLVSLFDAMNIKQYVQCPTRGNRLLDVLACSDDQLIRDVIVDDAGNVSDHRLIKGRLQVGWKRWTPTTYKFRLLSKMDFDVFEQSLLSSQLFVAPKNTVDAFADQLYTIVGSILNSLAPLRTKQRISCGKYINRFLSKEATHAKQKRRRLERHWKKTDAEADRLAYRQQCKLTNSLINESRRKHYADRIADMTTGSKNRWSAVNELLHTSDRSSPPPLHCDTISAFFNGKIRRLKDTIASRLTGLKRNPFAFDCAHSGLRLEEFTPVTVDEVAKLLNTMPAKSSPLDFVPTSVLKRCSAVFAPLIARLANLSFEQGRFPTQFKQAQITPLLKKAGMDINDPASYRPISNLNTISKIVERLALARLRPQITESVNFNKLQSAYRQHHSTETALLHILNDTYAHIDEGLTTLLVALDLSAAFDTVEHSVLLTRLEKSFGVTGIARDWISSYLADRTQFIHVGSESSAITNCSCGVPQGSVLGPLLFVAYTSPIAFITTKFGVLHNQYADDTQLYVALSKKDPNDTAKNLRNCLSAVHTWFSQNGLVINPEKSEAMLLSTAQLARAASLPLTDVNVAGCVVPFTDTVKILGVTIDRHLTFDTHVQNVCKSAYYHIRAMKHIRSSLTTDMARTVACALVNSRLDYANSVLYGTSAANMSKLQRVQNSLARVVTYTNRVEHIHPVLHQLHWLPINYRIDYKVATLAYKLRSTGSPAYLLPAVRNYTPTRQLRSSSQFLLYKPDVRTETARRAFSQSAPSVWNSLPANIRSSETYGQFRTAIRTHYYRLAFVL